MPSIRRLSPWVLLSLLPAALGGDILSTSGFSTCVDNPTITVQTLNVQYDRTTRLLTFDVAGTNTESQKVLLDLVVQAYGQTVYTKEFDPCDVSVANVTEMCPIPAGTFASQGSQTIPSEYADKIPSIAFSVPDLDGMVTLQVKSEDGTEIACIQSSVGNGQTFQIPAISYAAAGVAAAALALSAISALASGGAPGATAPSPSFGECIGWFQTMATNGMLSVQYPKVYQSFASNFAFSTGLIPWGQMQTAIDNFRAKTGGNITDNNYQYLKNNVTLVYNDGTTNSSSLSKRALDQGLLWLRQTTVDVNGTQTSVGDGSSSNSTTAGQTKDQRFVSGLQAYVEQLSIPAANTFMTILLVWAIVVAAIIVLILLAKAILEAWAQCGKLPHSLESWRKRYWWRMAKAIVNLILLLYGMWTLWCIYQFTAGDSWAAKVLAGITLGVFTAVLVGFTWKISRLARQAKKLEGGVDKLYDDKETWIKYSLFYDSYKKSYWWVFVPAIVYMFAKGCIIAGASGHGLVQASGQLIVEALMLGLLLWSRPYQRRSGKWINTIIQTVRVISVVCVLIFVEELGLSQTTKTITGVVLIAVQTTLTAVLALLIAVNAIITCVRTNPHRQQRKEAEKRRRGEVDDLTALDARNSLLMNPYPPAPQGVPMDTAYKGPMGMGVPSPFSNPRGRYNPVGDHMQHRDTSREGSPTGYRDDDHLVSAAAPPPFRDHSRHSSADSRDREPRLPQVDFGRAY